MRPDEAVLKIEAISAVRPEMKPVCDIALAVVRAAEAEIEKAETRAELAEKLVKDVEPRLQAITKVARDADAELQAVKRESARVVKRVTEEQRRDTALGTLAKSIEAMQTYVDVMVKNHARIQKDAVQLLQAIHSCTRDQNGKSAIQNRSPYAGSPWTVSDIDGALIKVVECRKDAVQLVVKLLEEEKLEAQRAKQPGAVQPYDPDDFVPGSGIATRPDVANDPEWARRAVPPGRRRGR